jgi:glyoxalase family protein
MESSVLGIHHITAITDDPQHNIDFYVSILGLRFVKKTVNFDAPDTYHLYYGDDLGRPGTILTFFSWPGAPKGRHGTGQATTISFSIPETAISYWRERLIEHGIDVQGPTTRFDEQVLSFTDHEGLGLELVAHPRAEKGTAWTDGPVPLAHAIRGFHGITLSITRLADTAALLSQELGFRFVGEIENRFRYEVVTDGVQTMLDLLHLPRVNRGMEAVGTVHHVAWRTANDASELEWRHKLIDAGLNVTPVGSLIFSFDLLPRTKRSTLRDSYRRTGLCSR